MSVGRLFRIGFEKGCGIPYANALQSEEYREILARELAVFTRFPPESFEGICAKASHFEITAQARSLFENEEIPFLKTKVSWNRKTLTERAKLRFLGKHLVLAGMDQLPREAVELAEKFRQSNDTEDRVYILMELFITLGNILLDNRKEKQSKREPNPFEWIDLISGKYDYRGVLPRSFGKFGESNNHPVCLGMAILLVSWARLANADVLLVHPLKELEATDWQVEGRMSQRIMREIRHRRLPVNPEFRQALIENIQTAKAHEDYTTDFHATVAIRVSETLWYYLDPYQGLHGFLPGSTWSLTWVLESIGGIDQVAPGIATVAHDRGTLANWYAKQEEKIDSAIQLSRDLEQALANPPASKEEFLSLLWNMDRIRTMGGLVRQVVDTSDPKHAIIKAMFGWKSSQRIKHRQLQEAWRKFESNSRFRRQCVRRLYGLPLAWGKKRYYMEWNKLRIHCNRVPPAMEVAIPEFAIALFVLNHLNCWASRKDHLEEFGLKHSSSQVLWHEFIARHGLDYKPREFTWLVEDSTSLVRSLAPHLHSRCRARLKTEGGEPDE